MRLSMAITLLTLCGICILLYSLHQGVTSSVMQKQDFFSSKVAGGPHFCLIYYVQYGAVTYTERVKMNYHRGKCLQLWTVP